MRTFGFDKSDVVWAWIEEQTRNKRRLSRKLPLNILHAFGPLGGPLMSTTSAQLNFLEYEIEIIRSPRVAGSRVTFHEERPPDRPFVALRPGTQPASKLTDIRMQITEVKFPWATSPCWASDASTATPHPFIYDAADR
jgi:hypothetical protein